MWMVFVGSAVLCGLIALPVLYRMRNDIFPAFGLALGVPVVIGPIAFATSYWFQFCAGDCEFLPFVIGLPFLLLFGFTYFLAIVGGGFFGVVAAIIAFQSVRRYLTRPAVEPSSDRSD
jgi:hypothetical protein